MKILSMFSVKESMRQMSMQDPDKFLMKLSQYPSLGFFENLFLVYSYEDGYSPLPSSKIFDNGSNHLSSQMCKNFWANVKVSIS